MGGDSQQPTFDCIVPFAEAAAELLLDGDAEHLKMTAPQQRPGADKRPPGEVLVK